MMKHLARHIIHFVSIVDLGSISNAAKDLNLTQPALTGSVRILEREFDGKLLIRKRGGAIPTPLGEQVYIQGKSMLASLDRVSTVVDAWHRSDAGQIIIGSTSLTAANFVPQAVAAFVEQRPDVKLQFELRPREELMTLLRQGSIDIFVGIVSFESPPEEIITTVLLKERLSIICGAQHPLAKKRKLKKETLADYPWMLPPKGTGLRQQIETAFEDFGIKNVVANVETEAAAALTPLLTSGNYLSLNSKFLLSSGIKSGNLVVLSESVPGTERTLAAFHRSTDEMTALTNEFINYLKEFAQKV